MARKEDKKPYVDEAMPELVYLFKNKEDAHNTLGSNKKVPFICPCCNKEIVCQINSVTRAGHVICSTCSDGFSYPEKMFSNILTQLNIEFDYHYRPLWAKPYIYDFKFTIHNNEYIVEMDGDMGHGRATLDGQRTGEESLAIDKLKDELALGGEVHSSKLSKLLDLSNIDWQECNVRGCGSKFREVVSVYNSKTRFADEISAEVGITSRCVIKYLNEAMHLGIIDNAKIFLNRVYLNKKLFHDIVKYTRYSVLFKYTSTIYRTAF